MVWQSDSGRTGQSIVVELHLVGKTTQLGSCHATTTTEWVAFKYNCGVEVKLNGQCLPSTTEALGSTLFALQNYYSGYKHKHKKSNFIRTSQARKSLFSFSLKIFDLRIS